MTNSRNKPPWRYWRPVTLARCVLLACSASSHLVLADAQQDMLVFVSLEGSKTFSASDPATEGFKDRATADFLYSYKGDQFRFLAEYVLSDAESELERLKAGWDIDARTTLWFGRFHSISNYWTSEYHHGKYMQTSISRPGLEEWEDESGPMPSHITGLWLEHELSHNDESVINLGLTLGLAPVFSGQELVPFAILDPESGHDLAISARVVYRPDVLSTNQVGMAMSHSDISVLSGSSPSLASLNDIRQLTLNAFSNWQWQEWRLIANLVYFHLDLHYDNGAVRDNFVLGYLQGEYEVSDKWTVFGRTEIATGEDDSLYLQLLPAVVAHRTLLGVRRDFARSHSLTLEVSKSKSKGLGLSHDSFNDLRIQWSAVFP